MPLYRRAVWSVFCSLLLLSSCDHPAPQEPFASQHGTPNESLQVAESGLQPNAVYTPPPGVPPEFHQPATIIETLFDIGFDPVQAYSSGLMEYYANRAKMDVGLTVYDGQQVINDQERSGVQNHFLLPAPRDFFVSAVYSTTQACGLRSQGYADYTTWYEWQGMVWSPVFEQDNGSAEQPDCGCGYEPVVDEPLEDDGEPCGGSGGSGGGGGAGGDGSGGGGGTNWCSVLALQSGCYEVYVDGQYDGVLCC